MVGSLLTGLRLSRLGLHAQRGQVEFFCQVGELPRKFTDLFRHLSLRLLLCGDLSGIAGLQHLCGIRELRELSAESFQLTAAVLLLRIVELTGRLFGVGSRSSHFVSRFGKLPCLSLASSLLAAVGGSL